MTGSPRDALDLRAFLPYRLSALTNRISRGFAALYSEQFGLGIPEWRVMAVLGQSPGLSADQVCARTEMDKVTVSRAVSKLLTKKYVQRDTDAADRRRSVLGLSGRGSRMYARIIPLARQYEHQLLRGLDPAQQRQLWAILDGLDGVTATAGGRRDTGEDGSP